MRIKGDYKIGQHIPPFDVLLCQSLTNKTLRTNERNTMSKLLEIEGAATWNNLRLKLKAQGKV